MTPDVRRVTLASALTHTPVLTMTQWRESSALVKSLVAVRAPVLVMTFGSAATGGALASWRGSIDVVGWLLCALGLLLAHATNNLLNDLTDSLTGTDRGNYFRTQYGTHVLEHGFMSKRALGASIAASGAAALTIGLYLVARAGAVVAWPLACGALLLLFYTHPMKRLGLGELAVLLVWGPLMVGGSALVASHAWSASAAWIGVVVGLAPTAVVFGKHIDKLEFDAARGIRTLPVRLGARRSRAAVVAMLAAPYPLIAGLVAAGALPWSSALVLVAAPDTVHAIRAFRREPPAACPPDYPRDVWPLWYSAHAFVHARSTTLALLSALVLAALVRHTG